MKKFVAHIRIEQHPNPERRTYHVNRLVSKVHMYKFGIDEYMTNWDKKEPGETGKKLAKALEKVPGVATGSLDAYNVDIGKGSAFSWNDVSPFVIGQIVKHIFPDFVGKDIEVSTTLHYISGDFSRHEDFAKHYKVPVKFGAKKRPYVNVEGLFNPQTLRKIVDNVKEKHQHSVKIAGAIAEHKKTANGGE